jgi:Rieske Fe-S protein
MLLTNPTGQGEERRKWVLMTGAVAGVAATATAIPFVSSFAPSERALAMGSSVEVDISGLAPGETRMVAWQTGLDNAPHPGDAGRADFPDGQTGGPWIGA